MKNSTKLIAMLTVIMLIAGALGLNVLAESAIPAADPSPAIAVYQKNAESVVGVITSAQQWDRTTRQINDTPISQGSGIVFAEGGYIVTNNHVIDGGDAWQILLPGGEKVDAEMIGTDSSTDLAVLKVADPEKAAALVPVELGASTELLIGSTAIAIGNPGGEVLSFSVTQGIVSALQRSNVKASNTSRAIDYIQHDASISSGNSGGGLFNYKGQLIGINTLKYAGNSANGSYEGLGFAIPVETVKYVADDLIAYGKVQRAQMGVTVFEYYNGPDEPMTGYAPAGVYVNACVEDGPAAQADIKQYDYIYSVEGVRVTSMTELTTQLDKFSDGDTVTIQVVRYANIGIQQVANSDYYSYFFGGYSAGTSSELVVGAGGYEIIDVPVTLKVMD